MLDWLEIPRASHYAPIVRVITIDEAAPPRRCAGGLAPAARTPAIACSSTRPLHGRRRPGRRGLEHAVEHHAVEMQVVIERRTETSDGPFTNITDSEGLRAAAKRAAALGFEGKMAIHPAQIELLNEVFSPSAPQLACLSTLVTVRIANAVI